VQEVAKFHTETDPNLPAMYTAVFLLAMNRNTYDRLSPELKAVIDSNSGLELSGQAGRLWEEQKAPARRLAVERGNNVYVVPAAELVNWQRAALPVIDDWIADMGRRKLDGNALLADARALLARNAKAPQSGAAPVGGPKK
jgi:TRAP-type C4-dicarboxylate transport system substrate-binding protein